MVDVKVIGDVYVEVHMTEVKALIQDHISAMFPDVKWDEDRNINGVLLCHGQFSNIDRLRDILAQEKIRDTVRSVLERTLSNGFIRFYLSKNALSVGKLNFSLDRGPLGDVKVELRTPDSTENGLKELIDFLTVIGT